MKISLEGFKCRMFEFISENAGLKEVLNYASEIMGVSVHITDAAYKLITASDFASNPDPLWEELVKNGFFFGGDD